jgi:FHS family glucose/mannose:H+ symporter-like MFS transporter
MIWPFIILSYISMFALGLSDNIRGPLFPEILHEFQLTDGQGSWMFAVASIFGFFGSAFSRHFIQKWNHIHLLDFALILMSVSLGALALAPNFICVLLASMVLGLSIGLMGVAQNVLCSKGTNLQRRRQIVSGMHAIYGFSSFVAPLIVAFLGSYFHSWRLCFGLAAIFPVLTLIFSLLKRVRVETRDTHAEKGSEMLPIKGLRAAQIYLAVAFGSYVVAEIMVSSRLALFVRRERNLDLEQSSLYVSGFFVLMFLGRLFFAWRPLKYDLRNQLSWSLLLSFVFIFLGLYVHPIFLLLTGLTMAPYYPLAIVYISECFPRNIDSAIASTMAAQSLLVVMMHFTVGYFSDWLGLTMALWVGPFFLLVALFILRTYPRLFLDKKV